jgi:DNA modification methylase
MDNGKINWTNDTKRLGDLKAWPRNPRRISAESASRLIDSLEDLGQPDVISIGPDNEVYNGHQRLTVWGSAFGDDHTVAVRVSSRVLTEDEKERLLVDLHEGAVGEWDFDKLSAEFDFSALIEMGFPEDKLPLDLDEEDPPEDPGARVDQAEELREEWGVESGQLWSLGDHRLICGDCTDPDVVAALMGNDSIDMVQIDPPYGVDYSGQKASMFYGEETRGKEREKIKGDSSTLESTILLAKALVLYKSSIYFIWSAPQYLYEVNKVINECGLDIFSVIVWNKNHANFGAMGATYKPKFEIAFACKIDKIPYYGPDNEVTVWDIDRSSKNDYHPTQKPVELFERSIINHTREGDIVVDYFLGGGTSLIAAERLGRICRAVEISPAYVAVAIQRWADLTGEEPILLDG